MLLHVLENRSELNSDEAKQINFFSAHFQQLLSTCVGARESTVYFLGTQRKTNE